METTENTPKIIDRKYDITKDLEKLNFYYILIPIFYLHFRDLLSHTS